MKARFSSLATVLVVLLLCCTVERSWAQLRVFISQDEIGSYFEGTLSENETRDHYVDIIAQVDSTLQTLVDDSGALVLRSANQSSTAAGSGSGMAASLPFPLLHFSVDQVAVSWLSSTEVSYKLDVWQSGQFEEPRVNVSLNGDIPLTQSGFAICFACLTTSNERGRLFVNLSTVIANDSSTLEVAFYIEKDCNNAQVLGMGGGPDTTGCPAFVLPPPSPSPSASASPSPSPFPSPLDPLIEPSLGPLMPGNTNVSDTVNVVVPTSLLTSLLRPSATVSETNFLLVPESEAPSPFLSESIEAASSSFAFMDLFPTTSSVVLMESSPTSSVSFVPSFRTVILTRQLPSSSSSIPSASFPLTPLPPSPSISPTLAPMPSPSLAPTSRPHSSLMPSIESSSVERPPTSFVFSPSPPLTSSLPSTSSPSHSASAADHDTTVSSLVDTLTILPSSSSNVPLSSTVLPSSSTILPSSSDILIFPSNSTVFPLSSYTAQQPSPEGLSSTVSLEASPSVTSSKRPSSPSIISASSKPLSTSGFTAASSVPVPPTLSMVASSSEVPSEPSSSPSSLGATQNVTLPPYMTSKDGADSTSAASVGVVTRSSVPGSGSTVLAEVSMTLSATPVNGTQVPPELLTTLVVVFAPVAGVLVAAILLLCCCLCCVVCCRRRKRGKLSFNDDPREAIAYCQPVEEDFLPKKEEAPLSLWLSLSWGTLSHLPWAVRGVVSHFGVDRRSLTLLSTTLRGKYGCIVNGQLTVNPMDVVSGNKGVMMKMLIGLKEGGRMDEVTKFLENATLLRGLEHPNILSVLRVSVEDNLAPIVAYPIVEYGNLHSFLTFSRVNPDDSPLTPVTIQWRVNFALQIARALKFLSDNGVVHPDLALRNCLLDTGYCVKVSDSALAQEFYPECYHNIKGSVRPVRWSAMETLQEGLCTTQSNVWSFGVTMWELVTLAEKPYSNVDNNRSILSLLLMDSRLHKPVDCPDDIYQLMADCWKKKAEERPNFRSLMDKLGELYQQCSLAATQQPSPGATTAPVTSSDNANYSRGFGSGSVGQPTIVVDRNSPPAPGEGVARLATRHRRSRDSHGSRHSRSNRGSLASRDSRRESLGLLQPEQLSLTFSVLSGETVSESGTESEGEEAERGGPAPAEYRLDVSKLPLLSTGDPFESPSPPPRSTESHPLAATQQKPVHPSRLLQKQPSHDETSFISLPSTFVSLTTHHYGQSPGIGGGTWGNRSDRVVGGSASTQIESLSFAGQQVTPTDSDTTLQAPPSPCSPSPDPTSDRSTTCDEILSVETSSSVLPNGGGTSSTGIPDSDSISKASTLDLDSVSTATSTPYPSSSSSQTSGVHSLPGHYNSSSTGDEDSRRGVSPLLVHHRSGNTGNSVAMVKEARYADEGVGSSADEEGGGLGNEGGGLGNDDGRTGANGCVSSDTKVESQQDSRNARSSFGLDLSDLTSDILSAFDKW